MISFRSGSADHNSLELFFFNSVLACLAHYFGLWSCSRCFRLKSVLSFAHSHRPVLGYVGGLAEAVGQVSEMLFVVALRQALPFRMELSSHPNPSGSILWMGGADVTQTFLPQEWPFLTVHAPISSQMHSKYFHKQHLSFLILCKQHRFIKCFEALPRS